MQIQTLICKLGTFMDQGGMNRVPAEKALRPDLAGMPIYGELLVGFADADDKDFARLREPHIVGPHSILPEQWLPGAKTVISFFAPFTRQVIESNAADMAWPSPEWLHARIDGQELVGALCVHLCDLLAGEGWRAVAPMLEPSFESWSGSATFGDPDCTLFNSNWSERHVASICGLGTFGLSAGLITKKGVAGRIGSVVTTARFPPTEKDYTVYNEYCNRCGTCIRNCPVGAITRAGKTHPACQEMLDRVMEKHAPYYGCGKCQVATPCAYGVPARRGSR